MTYIDLKFIGPLTFTDGSSSLFRSEFTNSSGVYLHTVKQDSDHNHLIHYIGETVSLGKRHREHLIHILGLNYGIFDSDSLKRGNLKLLWKGLWRDKTESGPSMQIEAYQKNHDDVLRYISALNVFFAELSVDKYMRKHIEGCIAWHLRNNQPEHNVLYPNDNRTGTGKNKNTGNLRITSTEPIRGLDNVIPF